MSSRALVARLGGVAPAGFAPDRRFVPGAPRPEPEPLAAPAPEPDPLAEAFDRGVAEGEAAAAARFAAQRADLEARYAGLARAFAELAAGEGDLLRARLTELVAQLCEGTLAPLALDRAALAARVERAAALLQRAADQRRVRLHPDDADLVRPLVSAGLELVPDPALARGALRIETEEGGIEDGPEAWRLAVREALGLC